MAPLINSIIGGFIALAGLMIGLVAWLRADMRRMEDRLDGKIEKLDGKVEKLTEDVADHRKETGAIRERMAHLEGLLDGLREAIVARAA